MKFVVINVERSQLGGVLKELSEVYPNMDIVMNIREEESKEKLDHQYVTIENVEPLQKETEK